MQAPQSAWGPCVCAGGSALHVPALQGALCWHTPGPCVHAGDGALHSSVLSSSPKLQPLHGPRWAATSCPLHRARGTPRPLQAAAGASCPKPGGREQKCGRGGWVPAVVAPALPAGGAAGHGGRDRGHPQRPREGGGSRGRGWALPWPPLSLPYPTRCSPHTNSIESDFFLAARSIPCPADPANGCGRGGN